jgi:hypothetical protein|nr:MAG TPA: hypothetical protein [Caudoviricetes sp.]
MLQDTFKKRGVINIVASCGLLQRELKKFDDEFITVEVNGREYVIDTIRRVPNYFDALSTHIKLICKDGGDGNIKR